jgi:hypothetical protein
MSNVAMKQFIKILNSISYINTQKNRTSNSDVFPATYFFYSNQNG